MLEQQDSASSRLDVRGDKEELLDDVVASEKNKPLGSRGLKTRISHVFFRGNVSLEKKKKKKKIRPSSSREIARFPARLEERHHR